MARAPFQVLVFPYHQRSDGIYVFAVFRRADDPYWQGIAGGGEGDETPRQAAQREAFEEGGIPLDAPLLALTTVTSVPVTYFPESYRWGDQVYVIPEYAFGVRWSSQDIVVSSEHSTACWVTYTEAAQMVRYDSNRVALWELHQKLRGLGPRDTRPD